MKETLYASVPSLNGNPLALKVGKGKSIAQYGELFQGEVEDGGSRRHRCLLSLPCRLIYSEVTFHPMAHTPLSVKPLHKQKALAVVKLTLSRLKASWCGGRVTVESTVPEAKGCGSSTADCIAAAVAAADAVGCRLSEEEIARLVVEAETASDNFMFSRAVLFAHREGIILEDYGLPLPALEVLGIDTAPEDHVKTLEFPPAIYSWRQHRSFVTLKTALRNAIVKSDVQLLGRVATASARINQLFLPKPMFSEVCRLTKKVGALGIAVAHSGTVLSVLFDPADAALESKICQMCDYLDKLGVSKVIRFQT